MLFLTIFLANKAEQSALIDENETLFWTKLPVY